MEDVSLTRVYRFPFISLLDSGYKSLRGLALQGYSWRDNGKVVVNGSSNPNGRLSFESLCLGDHDLHLSEFIDWAVTRLLWLRSLKISLEEHNDLRLLASCSTTLINLYLNISTGSGESCMSLLTLPELFTLSISLLQISIYSMTAPHL